MENIENNLGKFSVKRELESCSNGWGGEQKLKQAEERFGALMSQFEKKISELEVLEGKHSVLQLEKLVIEDEVQSLRLRNQELEEKVAGNLGGQRAEVGVRKGVEDSLNLMQDDAEDDKVMELMIENKVLQCEKDKAESEVQVWKVKCRELESRILELEERGTCMEEISRPKGFPGEVTGVATPRVDAFCANFTRIEEGKTVILSENRMESGSQARKQLNFGDDGSQTKKIAPATPASVRPASVSIIDISDSEAEENVAYVSKKARESTHSQGGITLDKNQFPCTKNFTSAIDQTDGDDASSEHGISPFMSTFKRKRAAKTVVSDSESDTDDKPISSLKTNSRSSSVYPEEQEEPAVKRRLMTLRKLEEGDISRKSSPRNSRSSSVYPEEKGEPAVKQHLMTSGKLEERDFSRKSSPRNSRSSSVYTEEQGEPAVKRRLMTSRKLEERDFSRKCSPRNPKRTKSERICGIPTDVISSDNEEEEDDSDGEEDDFIVPDSEAEGDAVSKDDDSSGEVLSGESDDASVESLDYRNVIATIGRHKDHKMKWEFQGDMQSDFGKDIQLCMKAVCVLYRQQTSEEILQKATIVRNGRGFNQCDAFRGTELGEFLTDGDPQGDLVKSVEELEARDPKWVELCRTLATHYANQLYEMYQSKEDPLWPGWESE